ncbi:MAG: iron-sulfur cluster assembly scaffold protein [Nanoarchaeota archaeon]|nr:iron-sulfur cluster assembly scaffold protein [Nanoarchaeota archaeon]MBU4308562.1 iron-sulfur cluster assembly scaffold protein [Nanoarchaeota archaeon]
MNYSKKVMQHFLNPKNMGLMKNPDGVGKVGNPVCGDIMEVFIKVKNKKISDIKFQTFGCVAAIASSSMITELAKGKTIEQAKKLNYKEISKNLKNLPSLKLHCSAMAIQALKKAIEDFEKNGK